MPTPRKYPGVDMTPSLREPGPTGPKLAQALRGLEGWWHGARMEDGLGCRASTYHHSAHQAHALRAPQNPRSPAAGPAGAGGSLTAVQAPCPQQSRDVAGTGAQVWTARDTPPPSPQGLTWVPWGVAAASTLDPAPIPIQVSAHLQPSPHLCVPAGPAPEPTPLAQMVPGQSAPAPKCHPFTL